MKNNKSGALAFCILLALIAIASAPGNADRINVWLREQYEAAMTRSQPAETAAPEAAQETAVAPTGPADEADAAAKDEAAMQAPGKEPGQSEGTEQATAQTGTAEPGSPEAAVQAEVVVPTFGLLRVEPDGSTVVAGEAGPSAEVEVLSGADTLATTTAEPNGDFVAVLEKPLAPGDYEIVLRSTEKNGDVAMSEETAVVSVPEPGHEGELLALVERPGAPSRLINTPKAGTETAEAEPAAQEGAAEVAEAAKEETTEVAAAEATPEAKGASAAPESEVAEATEEPKQETAEAAAETGDEPTAQPTNAPVSIAAVEIEDDMVFVAGTAGPGVQVRVYANEYLLGDTTADAGGRFLVEVRRKLAAGDYIIRADVIDPTTAEVVARAAVPFTRSAEETQSAVADAGEAAQKTPGEATNVAGVEETPAMPAGETSGTQETAQAPEQPAASAQPDAEQATAEAAPAPEMPSETAAATSEPQAAGTAQETETAAAETPSAAEAPSSDSEQEVAAETAPAPESKTGVAASTEPKDMAEVAKAEPAPKSETAPGGEAAESQQVAAAEAPAGPPEVSEDIVIHGTLHQTNSSVIIRRGDTLWHISRRVYGRGVRYTTIYLANQDQIQNPDKIWPGQIFELPKSANPDS